MNHECAELPDAPRTGQRIDSQWHFFIIFIFLFLPMSRRKRSVTMDKAPAFWSYCEEVPTGHHCMHPVTKGGIVLDWVCGHVCGEWICAPCSCAFGNEEGIFCCINHFKERIQNHSMTMMQLVLQKLQLHVQRRKGISSCQRLQRHPSILPKTYLF